MSLTIEPKKGIRLSLSQYSAIKTWQGGGKFWEHDFQLTVRQGALQEFLPRVTDEGTAVLYEQVVDGSDVVSGSVASSGQNKVPAAQIDRLRRALGELKAKAEDPHCDANKRRMIEAFRLPDPLKDAELYRIYGSGRKKRLLVLWGVEKEAGSAIAPLKALDRMTTEAGSMVWAKWLWLLLLLLSLAAAALFARSCGGEKRGAGVSSSVTPVPYTNEVVGTNQTSKSLNTTPASDNSQSAETQGGDSARRPVVTVGRSEPTATGSLPTNSVEGGDSAGRADVTVSRSEPTAPGSLPTNSVEGGSSATTAQRNANALLYPTHSNNQPPDRAAPGADGNTNGSLSSSTPKDATPVPSPTAPTRSLDPATNYGTGKVATYPTFSPDHTNTASVTEPTNTTDTPRPAAVASVVTGGATHIKISAVPQGETLNDQVTVLLTAAGQDGKGALVSGGFRVTRWIVDSAEQCVNGQPLVESTLPITLNKGVHRVLVEGESGSRIIRTEADVDVTLKHTTQSAVTVMPTQ